jgi:ankyrin repeat protein
MDLINAVRDGKLNDVKMLLQSPTVVEGINFQDQYGKTALIWASRGNTEIASLLLDKGADPNVRNNDGRTALMIGNTDIMKLLLSHKADMNIRDNNGNTVLTSASMDGKPERVKFLLDAGADINVKMGGWKTALAVAKMFDRKDVASVLIQHMRNMDKMRSNLIEIFPGIVVDEIVPVHVDKI